MTLGASHSQRPLRILHLEDNPADAELVEATLCADGLTPEIVRVETRHAFDAALAAGEFDLILADYNLPTFDGLSAQKTAAKVRPDLPFIFVSGSIGEEQAIDRVLDGATDYVLKDRIRRLSSAVDRALAESAERADRRRSEAEVRRLNAELEQRVIDRTQALADANVALARREAELEQTKGFLEDLVAASPSIMFRLNPKTFDVLYASPNIGWLLGYQPDEIVRLRDFWATHLHPDDVARVFAEVTDAIANTAVQIEQEYRMRGKDGAHHWFYSLMRVEYDDELRPITMLRYCLDIADRKLAEQQLQEARKESERANRAKSEFLSRMSHDLRTPLNAILGFAQLLESEDLEPDRHEHVQQILRGGSHLLELINEVLDLATIEAGRLSLSPEPVDACEAVRHAIALVAPLAAERHIALAIQTNRMEEFVLADRERLNQILLNFLSNAVKYNRPHGTVDVTFDAQPLGAVRICVADSGYGLTADQVALLFNPFERVGAESSSVEGTGLGLALTRKLAEAMGGSVGVSSKADCGSVFWVELPPCARVDAPSPPVAIVPSLAANAAVSGMVLYIEDNLSNVRLVERIFSKRPGARLVHAARADEGLAMARAHPPDMILLDLNLPGINGDEALRQIRADPALRHIPVAVLSADATTAQKRNLLAAGATAYLTKPLKIGEVLALLDRQLSAERVPELRPDARLE